MSFDTLDWESVLGLPTDAIINEKETNEMKLTSKLHKTDEEISSFTIEDGMKEIPRAVHLLKSASAIQKQSVINNIPTIFKSHPKEALDIIIPQLLEILQQANPTNEIILSSGKLLLKMIQDGLINKYSVQIYQICKKIRDFKDCETVNLWEDIFIANIKYLTLDIITNQIVPEALVVGGLSQPSSFRAFSCRILGAVCSRVEPQKFEKSIVQKVIGLCQDTDYEVRSSMCDNLNEIIKASKFDSSKHDLFHEYQELMLDEHTHVKERVISNMIKLLDFIDSETKKSFVIPGFKKIVEDPTDVVLVQILIKEFGYFLWKSHEVFTETELRQFMTFYTAMATGVNMEHRQKCAFNFPGVLLSIGPQNFEAFKMAKLLSSFIEDDNIKVRQIIAGSFHHIANQFISSPDLRSLLIKLLSSEELEILEVLFQNLNATLKEIYSDDSIKKYAPVDEVLLFIVRKERECVVDFQCSWRTHYQILLNFQHFPLYFDSEQLYERVVPLLFKILSETQIVPIKKLIVKTLCIYLRIIKNHEHREALTRRLFALREASNYHTRILFLDVIECILSYFSNKYFREFIFNEYLEMAHDPVANIRLRFVSILPYIRKTLRLPADNSLLQKLTDATEPLFTREYDNDVVQATGKVFVEFGVFGFPETTPHTKSLTKANSNDSISDNYLDDNNTLLVDSKDDALLEEQETDIFHSRERRESLSLDDKRSSKTKKPAIIKKSTQAPASTSKKVVKSNSPALVRNPTNTKPTKSSNSSPRGSMGLTNGSLNTKPVVQANESPKISNLISAVKVTPLKISKPETSMNSALNQMTLSSPVSQDKNSKPAVKKSQKTESRASK